MQFSVRNGIDQLLQMLEFGKYSTALVTNDKAFTIDGQYSRLALLNAGFQIKTLFSPEHGITAAGLDGAYQHNQTDPLTQLPVYSLYGSGFKPTQYQLNDIDQVVFDIPDVGCRFYTYLWTMTYVMEACAEQNIRFLVADRPNPVGANLIKAEGPWLDESRCSSFIGRWNIPLKHAATLGELARYFAGTRMPTLKLDVIPVSNYSRHQIATMDFPFVSTSPAIQHLQSALVYPGLGLLEGLNIDEGRGTIFPFGQFGAPWLDNEKLVSVLNEQRFQGYKFHAINYLPNQGIYKDISCKGIRIELSDYKNLKPVETGLAIIRSLIRLHPDKITERAYPTLANPSGQSHLDRLLGIQNAFNLLTKGEKLPEFDAGEWQKQIQPYLLYSE